MKANELRIGNYLHEPSYDECFNTYVVKQIQTRGLSVSVLEKDIQGLYDYKDMQPIPLTEEWLLRFGFELDREDDNYNYYTLEGFDSLSDYGEQGVSLPKNDKGYFHIYCGYYKNKIDCEFVHQLQNLYFALTNEELKEK